MSMCESCLIDITAEGSLQTGHPPPKLFVGPGEKLVLRTWECDAIWVWRKFIDDSGQEGINCAISETNQTTDPRTLSDRQTESLITAGLVRGITPMLMRRRSPQLTLDSVLRQLGGGPADEPSQGR